MIDKCRAKLAGTLGEYIYPCPLDKKFLEFLGVSGEEFVQNVVRRSDQEILAWVESVALPKTAKEIQDWNTTFLTHGPDSAEKRDYFNKTRDAIDPGRTDISFWVDLLDLEEGRDVPRRKGKERSNRERGW